MQRDEKVLTAKELAELPDETIDYSDIPELDDDFWAEAQLTLPESKERITLRVDKDIVEYFRQGGYGYQTRMNAVLRAYVDAKQRKAADKPKHTKERAKKAESRKG
jgi:uncharacterized protein (DUF4415 family)